MLSSATFAPRSALQNFLRNKGLSVFAVSVMAVVQLMIGVSLVLAHSFDQAMRSLEAKASTVSIFISDTTPMVNVQNLATRLRSDTRIKTVTYVSKAGALERYRSDPSIPPDMISSLEGTNPLPASLDVDVKDVRNLDAIATEVRGLPLLDKEGATNYRKEVIGKVILFSRFVAIAGGAVLVGLTAVAVFIIMMSIRTAVFVRRKEIEVMKLVGATGLVRAWPFLLEGMLAGLIASIISIGLVAGGYQPFVDRARGGRALPAPSRTTAPSWAS